MVVLGYCGARNHRRVARCELLVRRRQPRDLAADLAADLADLAIDLAVESLDEPALTLEPIETSIAFHVHGPGGVKVLPPGGDQCQSRLVELGGRAVGEGLQPARRRESSPANPQAETSNPQAAKHPRGAQRDRIQRPDSADGCKLEQGPAARSPTRPMEMAAAAGTNIQNWAQV